MHKTGSPTARLLKTTPGPCDNFAWDTAGQRFQLNCEFFLNVACWLWATVDLLLSCQVQFPEFSLVGMCGRKMSLQVFWMNNVRRNAKIATQGQKKVFWYLLCPQQVQTMCLARDRPMSWIFLLVLKKQITHFLTERSDCSPVCFCALADYLLLCSLKGFFFQLSTLKTTVFARVALTSTQILVLFNLL